MVGEWGIRGEREGEEKEEDFELLLKWGREVKERLEERGVGMGVDVGELVGLGLDVRERVGGK